MLKNSQVTKLYITDGKVNGLEFIQGKSHLEKVKIGFGVILAAGAINTPHLLMLSGIGPKKLLKNNGIKDSKIEGKDSNEWKLVDGIDLIIHIFHPEKRKFYDLERMWSELIPKERLSI